ncbi:MAG: radical SAM protein [Alicyclobacillus sp.]|nr:radical SAM protein [Alicyclobacillus sp.]
MQTPRLLYADAQGQVLDHPDLCPAARSGAYLTDVLPEEWIPLPEGAALVWLPGTRAIGVDPVSGEWVKLPDNCYAVGALLPQGFTRLLLPGYAKRPDAAALPLFGYTAAAWLDGRFVVAAHATDDPGPWNPATVREQDVEAAVSRLRQTHPDNRLYAHLAHCALGYGCMTAKNTFLGRYEAALPVSSTCNAGCIGCISEQPEDAPFPSPQVRLNFRPSVDEMVDVMLTHIRANPQGIVSFGQGCEGEPATRWPDIVQAIRRVRAETSAGYININTNGGLTRALQAVVDAGLDLMRVSIISAIPEHYNAYYRPRGYSLSDVAATLRYASAHGVYTSVNYLVFPGVTDREEEVEAMVDFLRDTGVRLVQMRNLNIDPEYYLSILPPQRGELLGMLQVLEVLRAECPGLEIGSYTHVPPT